MTQLKLGDIIQNGKEIGFVYDVSDDYITILRMKPHSDGFLQSSSLNKGTFSTDYSFDTGRPVFLPHNSSIEIIDKLNPKKTDKILRSMIRSLVEKQYEVSHKNKEFIPGVTYIRYAGRIYDSNELKSLVDSSLDFWLTAGRYAKQFESEFSKFLGVKHCILTNSGSSANLLAISALTSPKLEDRRLKTGDEVITTACGFPTTVNPILQNRLVPVFVDVELGTYNINVNEAEKAITDKTKAIFVAHTLGNPFNLDALKQLSDKHDLWLIEDSCDALGSKYNGQYTGTYGHISTFSFYPAHHITMGEGGALVTNDDKLKQLITSFRDWGRDCWCDPGEDDTCKHRFSWQLGTLPLGYDHKYIYSHIGYNLKLTDMQAAVGVEQLKKLPSFMAARRINYKRLNDGLKHLENVFIFPSVELETDPCWFGFILTVRKETDFTRDDIVKHLESNKIATRMLFAGNITRHPSFENQEYRISGNLDSTDYIMNNTFWIGVYPGITKEMTQYIIKTIIEFVKENTQ